MALELVLASASPRRLSLLLQAGLQPTVRPAVVDETPAPGEPAAAYARRIAGAKCQVASAPRPEALVLAADTVVHVGDAIYGKPADAAAARAMLGELAARWHQVTTAFALARAGRMLATDAVTTRVRFRPLTPRDIDRYVASGEPLDKAGGYGIQGLGGALVDQVEGSYTNVVGLPLPEVLTALARQGVTP
ncbi:MAG: septum formation protein Maf [Deltaproteobacteria bacterium]|nr:septum formation protein Maf [Deltaproteobacteria bacterium]